MNDYIDYYTYMDNLNQMSNINPIVQNEVMMPTSKNKEIVIAEPYNGFIQGNMFDNLYKNYQNYKIDELNPTSEEDYLLLLVQIYGFAAHDLELYLDVNPNDVNAIRKRNEYINMYKDALKNYEEKFGPITSTSNLLSESPWGWDTNKWPWEGVK